MLSIGTLGSGSAQYYIGLAQTDYYLKGGEPPGVWFGKGAERLGLTGIVQPEAFLRAFHGRAPQSGLPLVQNAGKAGRRPGWDLTFSAPKSVSTLWAVVDPEERQAIQQAHFDAVKQALSYLEREAAITRRGKGGGIEEKAELVIATFEHGTSRAQEPQLHTHALVLNLGLCPDGRTRALKSPLLYQHRMTAGTLYQLEFARVMMQRGYQVERQGNTFEVVGVPLALRETFSTRRGEILERMDARGEEGARAASIAALDTRTSKAHVARETLFARWQAVAGEYDFGPEQAWRLRSVLPPRNDLREKQDVLRIAAERLATDYSHFARQDFYRVVLEEGIGRGLAADSLERAVVSALETDPNYVTLAPHKGAMRYTTRVLFETERALLAAAQRLQDGKSFPVAAPEILRAVADTEAKATAKAQAVDPQAAECKLNDEQWAALKHVTQATKQIAVVSGLAGTGKTFLLTAARAAWEEAGFRVVGATVAGKAARGLAADTGIESRTLARLARTLRHNPGFLTRSTVLVVDEAGMVGTHRMAQVVAAVEAAGAKLVLTGDRRQVQPVEVGAPLGALEQRLGKATLTRIVRQESDPGDPRNPHWKRQAVLDFSEGDAASALGAFHTRGFLQIAESRSEAVQALIAAWQSQGVRRPQDNIIFAGLRSEVNALNRLAQEARRRHGQLGVASIRLGEGAFYERDVVLFTQGMARYGIDNGDTGVIESIDPISRQLRIRLGGGRTVTVSTSEALPMTLGYAMTTHKGQGVTVQNAFVLCGGGMTDRELIYVQASRARQFTHFFTERILVWNPDTNKSEDKTFSELVRRMSHSRQKDLAHDILTTPRPEPGPRQELRPQL